MAKKMQLDLYILMWHQILLDFEIETDSVFAEPNGDLLQTDGSADNLKLLSQKRYFNDPLKKNWCNILP